MTDKKLKILVIMGGPSSEYEVSLDSGREVIKHLNKDRYEIDEMVLPKDFTGFDSVKDIKKYDIVFNALHGEFGEDGKLQIMLDDLDIVYTGSGAAASAWGMDKDKTNLVAEEHGIKIPKSIIVTRNVGLEKALSTIMSVIQIPCIIKPNEAGSSIGIEIIKNESDLKPALEKVFFISKDVLVQEYISGQELTCAVLGNEDIKSFSIIEIIPKTKFYDYEAKYQDDATEYICPAKIEDEVVKKIKEQSVLVHKLIRAAGLTRSDFILATTGEVYFLEINTSPGMTSHSLCPKVAEADGMSYGELLDMIIDLALE